MQQVEKEIAGQYELAAAEAIEWLSECPITIGTLIAEGKAVGAEIDRIVKEIIKESVSRGVRDRAVLLEAGDPDADQVGEQVAVSFAGRLASAVHAHIVGR